MSRARHGYRKWCNRREFLARSRDSLLQMALMSLSLQACLSKSGNQLEGSSSPDQGTTPGNNGSSSSTAPIDLRHRYLINCAGYGGWDSFWFHNALTLPDLAGISTDMTTAFQKYHLRYRSSDVGQHPSGTRLGQAMGYLFPRDGQDLKDLMIWRGMVQEGQHGVGNKVIMHGLNSGYAASYSSVVAHAIGMQKARDLHYVQVSSEPGGIGSGFLTGNATPVNIPDITIWRNLTSAGVGDSSVAALNTLRHDTIQRLNQLATAQGLKQTASKERFDAFGTAYTGLKNLAGRKIADSTEFQGLLSRYRSALNSELTTQGARIFVPTINYAALSSEPIASRSLLAMIIADSESVAQHVANRFENLIFAHALAEYLITNELTAVVDLFPPFFDYHEDNYGDLRSVFASFVCFRELIRGLRAKAHVAGGNYLDRTTLILQTELDREPNLSTENPFGSDNPGTNHGPTISFIGAGAGWNRGAVLGGIKMPTDAFNRPLFDSLPIDLATGLPSAGGTLVSSKTIFPTICKMFGASVPANQTTEWGATDIALDPSRRG